MILDKFNILANIAYYMIFILILLSTSRTAATSNSLISSSPMSSAPNITDLNCLGCEYDYQCTLGEIQKAKCSVKDLSECRYYKEKSYSLNYTCAYCYQFPEDHYVCTPSLVCETNSKYLAECTMKPDVLCLGNRTFHRYRSCNIAAGYKWSTALLLSITVGGFGIDRFYLGYWQEGIGKLFSFGGFGVWTLVDIILIATGYLKPADGSRYISDMQFT